jgi:predicted Zn-dependent protease
VFNGSVSFSSGVATVSITLTTVATHQLTTTVAGVTDPVVLTGVEVKDDLTDFSVALAEAGDKYQDVPFGLNISDAVDLDGNLVTGDFNVTVTSNPEGGVFSESVTFSGGTASFTLTLTQLTTHNLTVSIAGITPTREVTGVLVKEDLSGFQAAHPGPQFINVPFQLLLSNGTDYEGDPIEGSFNVTVSSSIEGSIYDEDITFTAGAGALTLTLTQANTHNLTVTVSGVTTTIVVSAVKAVDTDGFPDSIWSLSVSGDKFSGIPFDLEITNARDIAGDLLTGDLLISVYSDQEGDVFEETISIVNGDASTPITITLNIVETHGLEVSMQEVTNPELLAGVVVKADQSGFDIALADPDNKYENIEFDLSITNAVGATGALLDGNINVTVSSNQEGPNVFEGSVFFVLGETTVPITLTTVATHQLTTTIVGVTDPEILTGVVVLADQSGFQVTHPGPQFTGTNINLIISNATDLDGVPLGGDINVIVTSQIDGERYNANASFTAGGSSVTIQLPNAGSHQLTVSIADVTDPVVVENVKAVDTDASGFIIDLADPGDKFSGIPFDLNISNATDIAGDLLNGDINVLITSNEEVGNVFNGSVTFIGGEASLTISLTTVATHTLTTTVVGVTLPVDLENVVVSADGSGFIVALAETGDKYQGVPFGLNISDAFDLEGDPVTGDFNVTVTSVPEGAVFSESVNFSGGTASLTLTLTQVTTHDLTVSVAGITPTREVTGVQVVLDQSGFQVAHPGPQLINTNFDLIISNATDLDGLPLAGDINVIVTSQIDGERYNDNASFTAGGSSFTIQLPNAGSHDLTVTITGVTGSVLVENVMATATDQSDFNLALAVSGNKYSGIPFDLSITNATDIAGDLLNGNIYVEVSSDIDGIVHNISIPFTDGVASPTITLAVGFHNITVTVTGITLSESLPNVIVAPDGSGFNVSLAVLGDKYEGIPFNLNITNAKGPDGINLSGDLNVTVTSDFDDEVFNGSVNFVSGDATLNITLTTVETHQLTVTVAGVTDPEYYIGLVVLPDLSGFIATPDPGNIYSEIEFDINITEAKDLDANDLSGPINVTVTSDLDGSVFNESVTFSGGSASLTLTLTQVNTHSLTVTVDLVTDPETIPGVVVLPDLSGFQVAHPGPQFTSTPFNLLISNATDLDGFALDGSFTVTVESDVDDEVFNGSGFFVLGAATVNFSLTTEATHQLTVSIADVTDDVVVENVKAVDPSNDASGFDLALADPGEDIFEGIPFDINISNATDIAGDLLNGDINVLITSNEEVGNLFNGSLLFVSGNATVNITLTTLATHTLTTTIVGVTLPVDLANVVVSADGSGFNVALAETGDKYAGVPFDLTITNAVGYSGADLSGDILVTVTSVPEGAVFSESVNFSGGTASLTLTLTQVTTHDLTVSVAGITPTREVTGVQVLLDQSGFQVAHPGPQEVARLLI